MPKWRIFSLAFILMIWLDSRNENKKVKKYQYVKFQ